MLMKRDEGGEIRPSLEEQEVGFSELGDAAITRARAIKLAGAALAGSAFSLLWAGEADARKNKKKRRRKKRRRRRRQVTSTPNPLNFGDTSITLPTPPVRGTTIENIGPDTVVLRPVVVGDGFSLVDGAKFTLAPGETKVVEVTFDPDESLVYQGELRIVDTRDGLVVENVDLLGQGVTL